MVGYSRWGHKESKLTEQLTHICMCVCVCVCNVKVTFYINMYSIFQGFYMGYVIFLKEE